jgi:hypothetical protein
VGDPPEDDRPDEPAPAPVEPPPREPDPDLIDWEQKGADGPAEKR